ncbi:MAG: hypothetical protein O2884_06255 [Chloroflexi bacterium]|nr:hypothetical protein [Chloroflexota bacterium]
MSTPPSQRKPRFFYGWVVVAVVAAGGFSASTENFPVLGVFLKPITDDLNWSRGSCPVKWCKSVTLVL